MASALSDAIVRQAVAGQQSAVQRNREGWKAHWKRVEHPWWAFWRWGEGPSCYDIPPPIPPPLPPNIVKRARELGLECY